MQYFLILHFLRIIVVSLLLLLLNIILFEVQNFVTQHDKFLWDTRYKKEKLTVLCELFFLESGNKSWWCFEALNIVIFKRLLQDERAKSYSLFFFTFKRRLNKYGWLQAWEYSPAAPNSSNQKEIVVVVRPSTGRELQTTATTQ